MRPDLGRYRYATTVVTGSAMIRIACLGAVFSLVAVGCSTSIDNGPEDIEVADPLADDYDECAERDWYGDGQCDTGCLDPDPDCLTAECDDACADFCEASWSGEALPALPDGCTPEVCECGDPPVECPDLCAAQCFGEPLPVEIPPDCPSFTCDCAEATAEVPEASGILPAAGGFGQCGARSPDEATRAKLDAADSADALLSFASNLRSRGTVPVVFHVIRHRGGKGNATRKTVFKQIRVLRRAFARTSYNLNLKKITHTTNNSWYRMAPGSSAALSAMSSLRRGGNWTMNIYSAGPPGLNGWSQFPWDDPGSTTDGVVIHHATMPGNSRAHFNHGDTLVHEVGHWLGLYHTFEGGCGLRGDAVSDTAAQATPSSGCPFGKNSCKYRAGNDPIRNYMDYTYHSCRNNFTDGQRRRMARVARKYRRNGAREEGGEACGDGQCTGDETDSSCPADCGCAAVSCSGVTPFGCYCDADCEATGDCCADANICE